jgi:hypothetical protein
MYTLFTHQYLINKSVPGSNTSRLLSMGVHEGWCLSEETSYTGWSTIKHRNVVCSYHAGHITERSSCSSSATSTVFGCRWWPLRTPTLNPKFKDISFSILLLYKYSSYDYRVIFFMSNCAYILLGHSVCFCTNASKLPSRHVSSLWGSYELLDDGVSTPKHVRAFD